ncbi:Lysozyme [compost metagenome]
MSTPTPLTAIASAHWQPALGTSGEAVEGLRDIDQAIRIILITPLGSDPHRPEFGCAVDRYLDWPINRVTPHLVREAVLAIRQWEPRVSVEQVLTKIDASQVTLCVQWRIAAGVLQQTEVRYARAATA